MSLGVPYVMCTGVELQLVFQWYWMQPNIFRALATSRTLCRRSEDAECETLIDSGWLFAIALEWVFALVFTLVVVWLFSALVFGIAIDCVHVC